MKRYFLFTGDYFYPAGGMNDFDNSFDSLEAAIEYVKASHSRMQWHHVVDMTTGDIVWNWIDGDE